MKDTAVKEQGLLDSRQTLSLYLETLFQEDVIDQEESIKQQSTAKRIKDIEVMLIQLGRHKLALPVKDLKTVIKLEGKALKHFPEQAESVLGVIHHQGNNIPVYDLNWLFNSKDDEENIEQANPEAKIQQVIILKGEKMAIACDESHQIITLNQNDVRWNKGQNRNRWLQGIVVEHMASLLDLRQIRRAFRSMRNSVEAGTLAGLA